MTCFTTIGAEHRRIQKRFFILLKDKDWPVREQAVEYLSRYARKESSKRAPTLFGSEDEPTKRGAYNLMKAILQAEEKIS